MIKMMMTQPAQQCILIVGPTNTFCQSEQVFLRARPHRLLFITCIKHSCLGETGSYLMENAFPDVLRLVAKVTADYG